MTLLHLEILFHYHITSSGFPRQSETIDDYIKALKYHELIIECGEDLASYKTTEKGKFYIEMLLSTPFPTQTISWKDPRV